MTTAKQYLNILRERKPLGWSEPPEIEKGLGYSLPEPYREFLQSCKMPTDLTVLVSVCGDSFGCSWPRT